MNESCGNRVMFTSMGVYTPEDSQTQRIMFIPDIYVERTIEGISDQRDEMILMPRYEDK